MIAPEVRLDAPIDQDAALVATLMSDEQETPVPAEVVRDWIEHWQEHGFGSWVVRDHEGDALGVVGLSQATDFVRVMVRTLDQAQERLTLRALQVAVAHAIEWLPDQPIRMRVAADDEVTIRLAVGAGLEHIPELDHVARDHTAAEVTWQVYEAAYLRVVDRIPRRARAALLEMWVRVTNAGGSVGFLPGDTAQHIAPMLEGYIERMERGEVACVSVNSPRGQLLGFGFVVTGSGALIAHRANLERVMVDPDHRGNNLGTLLMAGLHRAARSRDAELLTLDYRDGTGMGEFYARYGYSEVGRLPGAIRVAPDDDRDSVAMARRVDGRALRTLT